MTSLKTNSLGLKIGIGLLLFACLLWLSVLIIPFLALSTGLKYGLIVSLLVVGEIVFWVGTILVGKEFINKIKRYFKSK